MTIALIDLADAKAHLRVNNSDSDGDIAAKIEAASSIVLQVLKLSAIPDAWLVGSPAIIQAPDYEKQLTRLFLGELYFNREARIADLLSSGMVDLIRLGRTPTLA